MNEIESIPEPWKSHMRKTEVILGKNDVSLVKQFHSICRR